MKQKLITITQSMALLYLFGILTYIAFAPKATHDIHYYHRVGPTAPILGGNFRVLYYFNHLNILPSKKNNPMLVGHITGSGVIHSIAFHSGYYGIAVGYSVDNGELIWINNGHCLKEWAADSPNAVGMPVTLLSWKSKYSLALAINTPIAFKDNFKLYFINSGNQNYPIRSLHLYGYFKDLKFGDGNKLKK